jgi:alanine racemase
LRKFSDGEYLTHIANSGAIINIPETYGDFSMVRIGLLLFGVYPSLFLKTFKRKPFIEFSLKGKAKVLLVKKVSAGASIGYGRTYICKEDTRIALISIGYGDGLNRMLSNKIFIKINKHLLPSRGCISMDQMIVEIPERLNVKPGDECIFLDEELNVEGMAEMCGSVPHEIMCNFGKARIKRTYVR